MGPDGLYPRRCARLLSGQVPEGGDQGGTIIAKGTPDEIRNNPQVIEAYLGKKEG